MVKNYNICPVDILRLFGKLNTEYFCSKCCFVNEKTVYFN